MPQDKHAINKSLHSNKRCFVKWKVTHFASFRFPVLLLFCCLCRYFIMQSCWAFDSRKRPSFPNLTSFLGCQLADAEAAVGSSTVFHKTSLGRKELHHSELSMADSISTIFSYQVAFLITIGLDHSLKVVWG